MKNFFRITGLLSLMIFSFFYTEKTIIVVKEMDNIMISIKDNYKKYQVKQIPAVINNNTLIPGISGREVDINKSYVKMKQYGKYENRLLVYKNVLPNDSLDKNYDKFIISGNKSKRMISLIFIIKDNADLTKLLNILDNKKVRATIFIDGNWLENNMSKLIDIKEKGHTIGNYSYNSDYSDSSFVWIDTIIERIGRQSLSYCLAPSKDLQVINVCKLYKNTTILPNIIIKEDPLIEIKKQLVSGSLILLDTKLETLQQLPMIITYIQSRGYILDNITNHLKE